MMESMLRKFLILQIIFKKNSSKPDVTPELKSEVENSSAEENSSVEENKSISIVSTIFPQYDWVRAIIGEQMNVSNEYLLSSGIDLHNYQVTASDRNTILSADLLLYGGGESDEWVDAV